jgi:hypothetical protein
VTSVLTFVELIKLGDGVVERLLGKVACLLKSV